MSIEKEKWEKIRRFLGDASHATASPNIPYCVFATVNEDGSPRVAPYSSLILKEGGQGFYFDEFSHHLSQNLERDERVCVLLLKNKKWFWIKALLFGRFDHAPGIRLIGTVGRRRDASPQELDAFRKPLKSLKLFKGYQPLWGIMKHGREIQFHSFETIKCGTMKYMENL